MGNTTQQCTDDPVKQFLMAQYGENVRIEGDDYDKSLAVRCHNGTFVGKRHDHIIVYKGIPFVGAQPTGDLRWKAPVDVVSDDGVYEAFYNAKSPWQNAFLETGALYVQGEDCLYLNVWKADDGSTQKKPVMVWIYGGAFEAGGTIDPLYDCTNFLNENPDVIVVTIAYRLGVFGFLHLSHLPDGKDYPDAQNLGLMDQVMGLKWVHENIAGFGGDPDNVTIFGESAGAASVTTLPLIEGSQAYFKRVIAESGSPTISRSVEESIACTDELMGLLGCTTVADLQKVEPARFLEAQASLLMRMGPERDGNVLPEDPFEAYRNGAAKDIAFLHGCNRDEMSYFATLMGEEAFGAFARDRKAKKLARLTPEERALAEAFRDEAGLTDIERDCRLFDQIWFNGPFIRLTECQTMAGGESFSYYFTRSGHGVELTVVFDHPDMVENDGDPFDETFSKTVRRMWVQFATCGSPSLSADQSPDGKEKAWPLYDLESRQVMVLDEADIHPETESALKIVDRDRTYFMTRYFLF